MNASTACVAYASLFAVVAAPLAFALFGLLRRERGPVPPRARWDWRLSLNSGLMYAFSFSLIFFIQELFLVLPKALTPGLKATLFHNNHHWDGDNPLARLFQGTGALAILLTAIGFSLWLKLRPPRSASLRLFVLWAAFHGFFQSLPQVVVGAVIPQNDVGMAFDYLQLSEATKLVLAGIALPVIVILATRFARPLLEFAANAGDVATPLRRSGFMLRTATLPALLALPVIVAMRVPGSLDQVAIVPVAEFVIGVFWLQAYAWFARPQRIGQVESAPSALGAALMVAAQLLIFQFALRPGIAFF
ncbi:MULTISPECIES: hypothetical protein [Lysobacter]|uniref:hypothetical protein n=1 Tax=Lysobacter TaxID=68 RepID=UPI001F489AFC|nr:MULTISPECIES: hypothetical protein [Lysobacter]UJB19966.1 hypothetical protein L1A79_02400 [Lysobacter capsici]UJQ30919.1 hypothetical protein L2D09_12460 [Lysobacter gummosus]